MSSPPYVAVRVRASPVIKKYFHTTSANQVSHFEDIINISMTVTLKQMILSEKFRSMGIVML
jgi:hypothetical protein